MSESGQTVKPKDIDFSEDAAVDESGEGSVVYHESATEALDSVHDDRVRRILINSQLVSQSGNLLVDTVTYGPEVACPTHYHENTDHFFYVLEGEGVIEIEGEEIPLEQGTVAWIGRGDKHRLYCNAGQEMVVFEFFSNEDRETIWTDGPQCTWTPDSVSE